MYKFEQTVLPTTQMRPRLVKEGKPISISELGENAADNDGSDDDKIMSPCVPNNEQRGTSSSRTIAASTSSLSNDINSNVNKVSGRDTMDFVSPSLGQQSTVRSSLSSLARKSRNKTSLSSSLVAFTIDFFLSPRLIKNIVAQDKTEMNHLLQMG